MAASPRAGGHHWRWRPRPRRGAPCSPARLQRARVSASRREASEMSLIRRSSRRTSCWITSSRRARESALRASGRVSTALRREVSGFLQFVCHIRREALDRVDALVERLGHVTQGPRKVADLVGAVAEIRDLLTRLDPPAAPAPQPRPDAARVRQSHWPAGRRGPASPKRRRGRPAGARSVRRQ